MKSSRFYWKHFSRLIKEYKFEYLLGTICVLALNGLEMLPPIIFKKMTEVDSEGQLPLTKEQLFALALGSFALIGIFRFAWRIYFIITSRKIENEYKINLFQRILQGRFSHVSKLKVGEVVSLLSQDISDFRMFMGPGILVLVDMLAYFIFVPITLIYVIGPVSLLALIPLLAIAFYMPKYDKVISKNYDRSSKTLADASDHVYENAVGAKVFRSLGLQGIRRSKFNFILERLFDQRVKIGKTDIFLGVIIDSSIFTSYGLIFVFVYMALNGGTELLAPFKTVGSVVLALQILDKLIWPLMAIAWIAGQFEKSKASLMRLKNLIDIPLRQDGETKITGELESIKVEGLSFSYDDEEEPVLDNIHFEVHKGQKIGLVGKIGSGKSTLLRVLANLYYPDEFKSYKQLSFNGIAYDELQRESVCQKISYIPGESVIFNNTIIKNICPYPLVNKDRVIRSLELANFLEDLEALPDGMETYIGEKGVNLSGGQKQRVAIARSFYSGASLFLWDDTISALDLKTERAVISGLEELNPDGILFLATHRPSALAKFDQIFVLDKGRIIERGNFSELMKAKGTFYQLFEFENKTRGMRQSEASI